MCPYRNKNDARSQCRHHRPATVQKDLSGKTDLPPASQVSSPPGLWDKRTSFHFIPLPKHHLSHVRCLQVRRHHHPAYGTSTPHHLLPSHPHSTSSPYPNATSAMADVCVCHYHARSVWCHLHPGNHLTAEGLGSKREGTRSTQVCTTPIGHQAASLDL